MSGGIPGTRESPAPIEEPGGDGEEDERRDPGRQPPAGDPPPQRPPVEPPAPPRRASSHDEGAGHRGKHPSTSEHAPRIEIGWLVAHDLEHAQLRAVEAARDLVRSQLRRDFPSYQWKMPLVVREPAREATNEPVWLLDEGIQERAHHQWDFCVVVTGRDLRAYEKPFAIAAPSRAVGVAVLSVARLAAGNDARRLTDRIAALALHLVADLNGILHSDTSSSFSFAPRQVADLDSMREFDEGQRCDLRSAFDQVADKRVEEETDDPQRGTLRFFLRSVWVGRHDIVSAVVQAEPWAFPLRLGRLSAAAMSALLILMMTAEVWDVGMRQSAWRVSMLAVTALIATSWFIVRRQGLLVGHGSPRRSEQTVVANTSVALVVCLGMMVTFAICLAIGLAMSTFFFAEPLVSNWVRRAPGVGIGASDRIILATFVASLAVLIGALGASFEGKEYFRHTTFIDEET